MREVIGSGFALAVCAALVGYDIAAGWFHRRHRHDWDADDSHADLLAELDRHRDTSDDCRGRELT